MIVRACCSTHARAMMRRGSVNRGATTSITNATPSGSSAMTANRADAVLRLSPVIGVETRVCGEWLSDRDDRRRRPFASRLRTPPRDRDLSRCPP